MEAIFAKFAKKRATQFRLAQHQQVMMKVLVPRSCVVAVQKLRQQQWLKISSKHCLRKVTEQLSSVRMLVVCKSDRVCVTKKSGMTLSVGFIKTIVNNQDWLSTHL